MLLESLADGFEAEIVKAAVRGQVRAGAFLPRLMAPGAYVTKYSVPLHAVVEDSPEQVPGRTPFRGGGRRSGTLEFTLDLVATRDPEPKLTGVSVRPKTVGGCGTVFGCPHPATQKRTFPGGCGQRPPLKAPAPAVSSDGLSPSDSPFGLRKFRPFRGHGADRNG